MPNLIIYEVEDEDTKQSLVIGGYSSCGWTQHKDGDGSGGDSKCFVFNLTQNLRLQALSTVADKFTFVDTNDKSEALFKFGSTELVISPDLKTVQSDFSNSYYYAFCGDLILRDYSPRSIIPAHKVF